MYATRGEEVRHHRPALADVINGSQTDCNTNIWFCGKYLSSLGRKGQAGDLAALSGLLRGIQGGLNKVSAGLRAGGLI